MKNELIFPMALYVFYIFGVATYMFRMRVNALKNREVSMQYFKTYNTQPPPEKALIAARHHDNQFEVPMLFFVTGIMHFSFGMANTLTVTLMWIFVVSRFLHTFIHLGSNNVRLRMPFFTLGWMAILALWAQLVYFALNS